MKYVCLIYQDEETLQKLSKEDFGKLTFEYRSFQEGIEKKGQYIASHGLSSAKNARSVKVRNGKIIFNKVIIYGTFKHETNYSL